MNNARTQKRWTWNRFRKMILEPRVDSAELKAALRQAVSRQPPPVLWLIGKTQSGKTSIIRALTGSDSAEIGTGFKPCTRSARFYDYPPEAPAVRFLDTRGLGEVAYDPAEDIHYCESQAHLAVAVMKATDMRQEAVFEAIRVLRRRHPDWPLLVVQTCLHEAYPVGGEHPLPYPFGSGDGETAEKQNVPTDLSRALREQRSRLGKLAGTAHVLWVPVDLTLAEDDFNPPNYGLEALWAAIESVSSLGLQSLLRADPELRDAYSRAAHPHIMGYTAAAAGLGALPVVDLALVPALQIKLLHTLASLYKLTWNTRASSEFFSLLGTGFMAAYGLRWAGRGVIKLIPGWGQTAGALWGATSSAAVTYALGKSACYYLNKKSDGIAVDAQALRDVYASAFARGRSLPMVNKRSQS